MTKTLVTGTYLLYIGSYPTWLGITVSEAIMESIVANSAQFRVVFVSTVFSAELILLLTYLWHAKRKVDISNSVYFFHFVFLQSYMRLYDVRCLCAGLLLPSASRPVWLIHVWFTFAKSVNPPMLFYLSWFDCLRGLWILPVLFLCFSAFLSNHLSRAWCGMSGLSRFTCILEEGYQNSELDSR